VFTGLDAADRFLANAGAGGQLGLGPAGGLAAANDLPGDDDAGGFDRGVMAVFDRIHKRTWSIWRTTIDEPTAASKK
jgi:hypothetical protein